MENCFLILLVMEFVSARLTNCAQSNVESYTGEKFATKTQALINATVQVAKEVNCINSKLSLEGGLLKALSVG